MTKRRSLGDGVNVRTDDDQSVELVADFSGRLRKNLHEKLGEVPPGSSTFEVLFEKCVVAS